MMGSTANHKETSRQAYRGDVEAHGITASRQIPSMRLSTNLLQLI